MPAFCPVTQQHGKYILIKKTGTVIRTWHSWVWSTYANHCVIVPPGGICLKVQFNRKLKWCGMAQWSLFVLLVSATSGLIHDVPKLFQWNDNVAEIYWKPRTWSYEKFHHKIWFYAGIWTIKSVMWPFLVSLWSGQSRTSSFSIRPAVWNYREKTLV